MRISAMLLLIMFIMTVADVGGTQMRFAHLSNRAILFFIFSIWVMSLFEYSPISELALNPACIIAAAWLYGASFAYRERYSIASIPLAAIIGIIGAFISFWGIEGGEYIAGLAAFLPSLFLGSVTSLATAAFAPLFSALYLFAYDLTISGYGVVEMTETTLSVQLIGFAVVFLTKSSLRQRVPKKVEIG